MSFITSPAVIVPPLTAGGVAYGNGTQAFVTAAGTAGQVLTSSGAGVPTFTTPSTVTFPITVPQGGTNLTTLTANNVIIGNGTSAPLFVAPGTSGNVLSSNGTTWASTTPAAGGGTVTLTSSGSITAGLGVIVNSNGTGSTPVLTRTITPKTQATVASNISANKRASMIYCESVKVYIAFYIRVTDDFLCAKIGTVTGNGIFTWGTETVLNSSASTRPTAIWVNSQAKFYVSYDDATNGQVRCGTVTSTDITIGSQLTMFANAGTPTTIAFDLTAGILVYGSTTTGSGFFNFSTINTSGITLTANTQIASSFTANSSARLFYWPLAAKVVCIFNLSAAALNAAIITITGVSPTIGSNQLLSNFNISPTDAAFSSTTSNLFLLTNDGNAVALSGFILSISGSTITAGSVYSITDGNIANQSSVNYVPGINAFVVSFGSKTPYKLQSLIATVSGTVINFGSATTLISSTTNAYPYGNVYDNQYGFITSYTVTSGADNMFSIAQTNGSTTLTSDNFIGVAKTSVSTGNSFDVSVSGSVNTVVSGLTTGSLFYLDGSGNLITSQSPPIGSTLPVKVGLALSPTSIVMK